MPLPEGYNKNSKNVQKTPIGYYIKRNLTVDKKIMVEYINSINKIEFSK